MQGRTIEVMRRGEEDEGRPPLEYLGEPEWEEARGDHRLGWGDDELCRELPEIEAPERRRRYER